MIGVFTHTKPCSSKKRWIAMRERVAHARACADHVGARAQVRTSRRNSSVCGFGWIG
jgi:hypothetical protein